MTSAHSSTRISSRRLLPNVCQPTRRNTTQLNWQLDRVELSWVASSRVASCRVARRAFGLMPIRNDCAEVKRTLNVAFRRSSLQHVRGKEARRLADWRATTLRRDPSSFVRFMSAGCVVLVVDWMAPSWRLAHILTSVIVFHPPPPHTHTHKVMYEEERDQQTKDVDYWQAGWVGSCNRLHVDGGEYTISCVAVSLFVWFTHANWSSFKGILSAVRPIRHGGIVHFPIYNDLDRRSKQTLRWLIAVNVILRVCNMCIYILKLSIIKVLIIIVVLLFK